MTTAVAALTAGYIALAVLLLSLNLTSLWRWWIKAGAIIATTIFFGVTFQALGGLTGWPTTQRRVRCGSESKALWPRRRKERC